MTRTRFVAPGARLLTLLQRGGFPFVVVETETCGRVHVFRTKGK